MIGEVRILGVADDDAVLAEGEPAA